MRASFAFESSVRLSQLAELAAVTPFPLLAIFSLVLAPFWFPTAALSHFAAAADELLKLLERKLLELKLRRSNSSHICDSDLKMDGEGLRSGGCFSGLSRWIEEPLAGSSGSLRLNSRASLSLGVFSASSTENERCFDSGLRNPRSVRVTSWPLFGGVFLSPVFTLDALSALDDFVIEDKTW